MNTCLYSALRLNIHIIISGQETACSTTSILPTTSNKCTLVSPNQTQWTFPFLTSTDLDSEDYEKLKTRLFSESDAIMMNFINRFATFFQSLSDQKIHVKKIVASLKTFGAFGPIYKGENQPLLKDELGKLDLATTDMDDIMSIVTDYCSFFNYRLLSFLVSRHGTQKDKESLEQYEKEFSEYAKRRIFECPSEFGEMTKNNPILIVKLDDHYQGYSLNQLRLLETDLCKVFHVSNLNLRQIRPGCLQLIFQLPSFVQKALLPLSQMQEEKLVALHVLSVDCGDYHFTSEVSVYILL